MKTTDPTTAPVRVHMGDVVISMSSIVYDTELPGIYYFLTEDIEGWDAQSGTKGDVTPKPVGHGSWGDSQYFDPKDIVLKGMIVGEDIKDPSIFEDAIEKLQAAIPVGTDEPFVVYRFGRATHVMARQGGQPTVNWVGKGKYEAEFDIQLVALDPRKLSGDGKGPTKSISTPLGTAGQVNMVNAGRGVLPPHYLTFTDCLNPKITVDGLDGEQWFEIDLRGGDPLVVDYDNQTVTRNGENVFNTMRGDWIDLRDKVNIFKFTADAYGSAASLNVKSYDSRR